MKAIILDSRIDGTSKCFLCRITLEDYVSNLPTTYQDYDIQRELVSNVYLDRLVDTVLAKKHIPPIVLIVENGKYRQEQNELQIEAFKILDGLQRTFRLQVIRKTIAYCLDKISKPAELLHINRFKLSRQFSSDLRDFNSTTDILLSVINFLVSSGAEELLRTFSENGQWFEIWTEVTPDEEVRMMLTLNAGHKPVKTRHQLELLFLNLLPLLKSGEGETFDLVREKEVASAQFSKKRIVGSFHFAHVLSSLLSLYAGKPITPSAALIQDIQTNDPAFEEYGQFISPDFLKTFVDFLVRLDKLVSQQYGETGVLWMGREVTLAGLFGALGFIAKNSGLEHKIVMNRFSDIVKANVGVLSLDQFEDVRNNLNLSKVNIGSANRDAVFGGVRDLLAKPTPSKIDWSIYFRT